jgi:hypothetical protein
MYDTLLIPRHSTSIASKASIFVQTESQFIRLIARQAKHNHSAHMCADHCCKRVAELVRKSLGKIAHQNDEDCGYLLAQKTTFSF